MSRKIFVTAKGHQTFFLHIQPETTNSAEGNVLYVNLAKSYLFIVNFALFESTEEETSSLSLAAATRSATRESTNSSKKVI